jgi:hypothetical protein
MNICHDCVAVLTAGDKSRLVAKKQIPPPFDYAQGAE